MRVVFIPLTYLPTSSGGAPVAIHGVAKQLQRQGHEVSVLTAERYDVPLDSSALLLTKDDTWDGLPVRRLFYDKAATGWPAPWYDTLNIHVERAVTTFLKERTPDVVHLTCGQHLSASPIRAAKALGYPVVLTLMGYWYICPLTALLRPDGTLCNGYRAGAECLSCLAPRSRVGLLLNRMPPTVRRVISRINLKSALLTRSNRAMEIVRAVDYRNAIFLETLRSVDLILAPSREMSRRFVEIGAGQRERILYWPHSINVKSAERGRVKTPSTNVRFGYTGHIMRYKGLDILLRAFRQLPHGLPVELKVYGSLEHNPQYAQELITLAKGDPRISFLGSYKNNQIGEILSALDVVVLPSVCVENSPVAIHEALAARTPVIATRVGGIPDLIQHEFNGLLFERGNVADLAQQMLRLVSDPELVVALGANAKPVRGVEEEATELTALYQQLRAIPRGKS